MPKIKLTKSQAAGRQIEAAIRMTFGEEDPVAVLTVIAAASRIVRDLCEHHGKIESYLNFKDMIVPGREAEFWKHFNAASSFIKHADRDPFEEGEINETATDFLIIFTARWFRDLGNEASPAMHTFTLWWAAQYPDLIKEKFLQFVEEFTGKTLAQVHEATKLLNRSELLALGNRALQMNS